MSVAGGRTRPAVPAKSSTFGASKFHAPSLPQHHVARPTLRDRLDGDGSVAKVVIGSPGAGKTKLLAEWFHSQASRSACWLNVDEGDRDPVRFWRGFVAAVRAVEPGFGTATIELLELEPTVDHEVLESVLIAVDELSRPLSIVLDDFHLAGADVHQQTRFVLGRLSGNLRLLVGSRSEPEIGLHRLRLDGRVEDLREADLRFDAAGADELLRRLGVDLPVEALEVIVDRTEGWAAGLQLAALALRDTDDTTGFVARLDGTHQVIAHYLWSEVFAVQTPDVQRFLTETCVVDELSPPLAAALTPGNPVTLLDIEAASLLLRRVDGDGQSYRFHQLLTDMLRLRLHTDDAAREAQLHDRAARWFEEHGDSVAAFRHRWRAGQRTDAMRAMHGSVLDVVFDSLPAMTELERSLTDADILAAPGPATSFAAALIIGGFAVEADRLTSRILELAAPRMSPDDLQQLVAVRSSAAIVLGDSRTAADLGAYAESRGTPERWTYVIHLGAAKGHAWEGEYEEAAAHLAGPPPPRAPIFERMEAGGTDALRHLFEGGLRRSRAAATACLDDLERDGVTEIADGMLARAVLGAVTLEQGGPVLAEELLRSVADVPSAFRVPARVVAFVALARLWLAEGQIEAAQLAVIDCYRLVRARPERCGVLDHIRAQEVHNLIVAGQHRDARRVIEDVAPGPRRQLLAAEVHIAESRLDEAKQLLCELAAGSNLSARTRLEHSLARLRIAVGGHGEVDAVAAEVFALGAQEGWLFPLVEAGADALSAVQISARRAAHDGYADAVMRLRPRVTPSVRRRGDPTTLTERERIVLRYLATSMSYREMAADLWVSPNTLKTHVKNINRKLGTGSRAETVRRARELHCL